MPRPPNPISQGFRAVFRNPSVWLIEIGWRWSFTLLSLLLVYVTIRVLLVSTPPEAPDLDAWRSHVPLLMGLTALHLVRAMGGKALAAALVLPLAISLVWIVLSAIGRRATLIRLSSRDSALRFLSVLGLSFWRCVFFGVAAVLLLAALVGEAYLATRSSKPDLTMFYCMVLPTILVVGGVWTVLNWYYSLAAVCGDRSTDRRTAVGEARSFAAEQRSDLFGIGFVFLLLRIVALLIAFVACFLPSNTLDPASRDFIILTVGVSLVYFAVADFLYVTQLAAKLALRSYWLEGPAASTVAAVDGPKMSAD